MNLRFVKISSLLLVLSLCPLVHAATRYVSHSGNNTFPFTTWETAANTIEAANLATLPGDTMFVDTGAFQLTQTIVLPPKITLRGKGMDSTLILGSDSAWTMFFPDDSTYVRDIHFNGLYNYAQETGSGHAFGKYATEPWRVFFCQRCRFSRFGSSPIAFDKMIYVEIKDCWFETWESSALSLTERGNYVIENNTFDAGEHSISFFDFMFAIGNKYIRNNIFLGGGQGGIEGGTAGRMEITNNLFYKNVYLPTAVYVRENELLFANNSLLISHLYPGPHTDATVVIINDNYSRDYQIYNNIFVDYEPRIEFMYPFPAQARVNISHNCFFATNPAADYDFISLESGAVRPDSVYSNILNDPMLVDPVNGDFHLQLGSPCIDAGVPWVLDVDGTRSDMGAFGGPGGAVYAYVDYPPKPPSEFAAWRTGSRVVLSWYRNRESDLHHYILFRSEQSPVALDSAHVLVYLSPSGKPIGRLGSTKHLLPVGDTASLPDKSLYDGFIPLATPENLVSIFYCDNAAEPNGSYYYALVVVDSSLLASSPSDEAAVTSLSADNMAVVEPIEIPVIEQNYPNPFNAVTAIVYSLPNIGAQPAPVRLVVYNILGQEIKSLANEKQQPGRHVVSWDGTDQQGQPVASGVYLYRLEVSGIEFVKSGKMILMK
jgi:hypothetical protein